MAVVMLTRFKGDQDFSQGLRERAAIVKKHGAVAVRGGRCVVGPYAGQVMIAFTFADWATYGRAMDAISTDADFQRSYGDFASKFELLERSLIAADDF